jgi:hypothetical protein
MTASKTSHNDPEGEVTVVKEVNIVGTVAVVITVVEDAGRDEEEVVAEVLEVVHVVVVTNHRSPDHTLHRVGSTQF